MLDFSQKPRAWPENEAGEKAKKGAKRVFFNYRGAGTSEIPRVCPRFARKSLSVEQFSCTFFPQPPTFTLSNYYKREIKPYKRAGNALQKNRWSIFSPTFFSGKIQKARACYLFKIKHLTPKHPIFEALHFCLPLPPGEIEAFR